MTTGQPAAAPQGPPPDVEALLAASRRLEAHADLLDTSGRRLRLEAEQAPWVSQAAGAARTVFEHEAVSVAGQARELREAAGRLRRYAQHVAERIAVVDAAASVVARSVTDPAAGAMWSVV